MARDPALDRGFPVQRGWLESHVTPDRSIAALPHDHYLYEINDLQ
jgi:hypothetical protein